MNIACAADNAVDIMGQPALLLLRFIQSCRGGAGRGGADHGALGEKVCGCTADGRLQWQLSSSSNGEPTHPRWLLMIIVLLYHDLGNKPTAAF